MIHSSLNSIPAHDSPSPLDTRFCKLHSLILRLAINIFRIGRTETNWSYHIDNFIFWYLVTPDFRTRSHWIAVFQLQLQLIFSSKSIKWSFQYCQGRNLVIRYILSVECLWTTIHLRKYAKDCEWGKWKMTLGCHSINGWEIFWACANLAFPGSNKF